ncbi:MAG: glycosyltransferase family 2 protein, partial [Gammaproteobacteria bacterium]|nr:glycosyltransferase family 2 protein [Gammaproteobacteria bacterium]
VAILAMRALAVRPSLTNGYFGRKVAHYTYGGELPSAAPHPIALASGCFMFCRTSALQKVNGFDERYFLYFEDYDLSLRMRQVGEIMEVPFARITHYGGHTMRRGLRRVGHFVRSSVTYFNAHGWMWL